ncbi:MAG TPA: hypothetical protein VF590_04830, partial [Isosphaeraceae bacterium]
ELRGPDPGADGPGPIVVAAAQPLLSYYQAALRCLGFAAERIRPIPPDAMAGAVARGQWEILARSPRAPGVWDGSTSSQ